MQATKSLILKAVADAQKSVAARPFKAPQTEPEAKPILPALFTRSYRERHQVAANTNTASTERPTFVIKQEQGMDCAELEDQEMEDLEEAIVEDSSEQMERSIIPSLPAEHRKVQTRFVVTLDGADPSLTQLFDRDFGEEEVEMAEPTVKETERRPVKSRLFRRRSTGKYKSNKCPCCIRH